MKFGLWDHVDINDRPLAQLLAELSVASAAGAAVVGVVLLLLRVYLVGTGVGAGWWSKGRTC